GRLGQRAEEQRRSRPQRADDDGRQCRRRPRLDGPLRCPDGHRCRGEQRDERDAPMSLTDALAHNRSTAGTRAARGAVTSATVVLLIAVSWALLPGLFTHFDPNDGGDTPALLPPSLDHWFGTDQTGRDAFTRVVYGASQSLLAALVAVGVGLILGTAIGLIAG